MALKSDNPLNAEINRNFVIEVFENIGENQYKKLGITSANKLSIHLQNEELKIRLFNEVLEGTKHKYTYKIRNRLKINFHSK